MEHFEASDGKVYNLSPLTLGDLRRFTHWVQFKDWNDFQEMKDELQPDDFSAESKRLLQECSRKRLHESSPEVQAAFTTLEGSVYLLYLSVKRNHNITYDQLADILTLETIQDATAKLGVMSGLTGDDAKKNEVTSN